MSLGLDIGSKSIKVIEISQERGRITLKSAGAVGYSGTSVEDLDDEKNFGQLASSIKKLLSDAKISTKNANLALPESHVFSRIIKFPLLTDEEIGSAVKWEAEEYIPIPIEEAIIEHQILERQEVGNPPQVMVLLVAVLRKIVEKYVKVANMAGLSVENIETELMSMTRSLAPSDKSVVIVDFGANSTDMAIAKRGELFFSRSIPTGGDAFTRAVAQSLGISLQQAEEYKRTYGLLPGQLEGKVGVALTPILKIVSEEIKKAIHYYEMDFKGEKPSSVILSGGSASLPGVLPLLSKLLDTEVVIGDPFAKLQIDANTRKKLSNFSPLYSAAVGLALRE